MLVGVATLPTAPLLVPGVCAAPPDGLTAVADAVDTVVERLGDADVAVLLSPGGEPGHGVYDRAIAHLAGVGRPDIRDEAPVPPEVAEAILAGTGYVRFRGDPLPLSLGVLVLLLAGGIPVVPVAVPLGASFDALVAAGIGIGRAVAGEKLRAVVVASGDLSAGLGEHSPMTLVDGARDWDDRVRDVVDSGRLDGLSRLGPGEARRVGALGWEPMVTLHGCLARSKLGLVGRHYSAPLGVGYLVAHGG